MSYGLCYFHPFLEFYIFLPVILEKYCNVILSSRSKEYISVLKLRIMAIFLKQRYSIILSYYHLIVILCHGTSEGYGYKKNDDPIITAFKSVIFYGKKSDWDRIKGDIDTISDRIDDVKNIFAVDLRPGLNVGLFQHDFQKVVKVMANLVFLAIKEKYHWNISEGLRMFTRAKIRLRLADEYPWQNY